MRNRFLAVTIVLIGCSGRSVTPEVSVQADLPGVDLPLEVAAFEPETRNPEPETVVPVHPWPTCLEYSDKGLSLAEKAVFLDDLVVAQHLPDGLLRTITVEDGGAVKLHSLPSTGLWTAIYLASQALRYAVTGDEEAQVNAGKAVEGLHHLTAVTGSSGLYGRAYQRPDFDYAWEPTPAAMWRESEAPGYEGWWWNYTVSKDTMDGIMFGYAVALEHLDDEAILSVIRADVLAFADHLVSNDLQIIDWDGKVTEHGRMFYSAMDDFPGFNAVLVSSWLRTALYAGGGEDLQHFYWDCLMRKGDYSDCPEIDIVDMGSYMDAVEKFLSLYMYDCKTNYDHFDMVLHAVYPWMRLETDSDLKKRLHKLLEVGIWRPPDADMDPPLYESTHSLYIFMYGGLSSPPVDDPIFPDAVNEGVCTMYRLPHDRSDPEVAAGDQEGVCINRLGRPNAAEIIPVEERYYDNYLWRLDPYEIPEAHTAAPGMVHSPDDYLLAYWLGRYHGFITPEM